MNNGGELKAHQQGIRFVLWCFVLHFAFSPAIAGVDHGNGSEKRSQLDSRIGKADAAWLKLTDKEWDNPVVYVDHGNVYVLVGSEQPPNPDKKVDDVVTALIHLPVTAWPHGRAVLLLQSGRVPIRFAGQLEPTDPSYLLLKRTRVALRDLNVVIVEGPVS